MFSALPQKEAKLFGGFTLFLSQSKTIVFGPQLVSVMIQTIKMYLLSSYKNQMKIVIFLKKIKRAECP